jgi:hypothetical protein
MKHYFKWILVCAMLLQASVSSHGQTEIFVNMAMVDGVDLTPDNLLSFQIQSSLQQTSHSLIKGNIKFRNSELRIAYKFEYDLRPGLNIIDANMVHPQYEYSSQALRELFTQYKKLPEGLYEYCVSVKPNYNINEPVPGNTYDECVYHKSQDIFLITLVDPDNDAKIYEYNPMLSWSVNYPFASELKYRLRVAEIKEGQNTVAAINRNNPVYDEKNLMQLSQIYPVYAKPLQKNQPYAWTVDAYYKGLLIGGAEPWKFTIIEDSLLVAVSSNQAFYEFTGHHGETSIYAIDTIKLKYRTYETSDSLALGIKDIEGKEIKFKTTTYKLEPGTNYIALDLPGNVVLSHFKDYVLYIQTAKGKTFQVPFKYVNPLFLKK